MTSRLIAIIIGALLILAIIAQFIWIERDDLRHARRVLMGLILLVVVPAAVGGGLITWGLL